MAKKYTAYWIIGLVGMLIVGGFIGFAYSNSKSIQKDNAEVILSSCYIQLKNLKCPAGQTCMPEPFSWICNCAGGENLQTQIGRGCKINNMVFGLDDFCSITQDKSYGFCVNSACQKKEPTTREELISYNSQLRQEIGYPPEPFLIIPEKEYQGTNGYFPYTSGEATPLLNVLCSDFFNYLINEEEGTGKILEIRDGRKIYYGSGLGYVVCIGNDKLGISANNKEVIDKYFEDFVC